MLRLRLDQRHGGGKQACCHSGHTTGTTIAVLTNLHALYKDDSFKYSLLAVKAVHVITMVVVKFLEKKYAKAMALKNTASIVSGIAKQAMLNATILPGGPLLAFGKRVSSAQLNIDSQGVHTALEARSYTIHGGNVNVIAQQGHIGLVSSTGDVLIDSVKGSVTVAAGGCMLEMSTDAKRVSINSYNNGEIKLQSSRDRMLSSANYLRINEDMISIAYKEFAAPKGSIKFSATGLELIWGQNKITIDDLGIRIEGTVIETEAMKEVFKGMKQDHQM